MPEQTLPKRLLQNLTPRVPEMLEVLQRFVEAESPSIEKEPSDRCCDIVADAWKKRGVAIERLPVAEHGDILRMTWQPDGARSSDQLFVLGHYDTVYATGTLGKMPFRVSGGKVYGPGTFDMKGGIVQALFALEALQHLNVPVRKRIVFMWTSDEELGSFASRELIESEAKRSDAVFVLEPSFGPRGLLKTARKGVGQADLIVHGRASHAGLAPQEGVNAVHELALQLARTQKWNDLKRGITVNADIIEGGSRVNVIADRAKAVIDLRALRISDMRALEKRLHGLRPILRGARLEVQGGFNRAPLERKATAALFVQAQKLGKQMGVPLGECTVGGGSDGNLTGSLGIPTLDGLGAVGDGAHSLHEHVIVKTMPVRAALVASLLATV